MEVGSDQLSEHVATQEGITLDEKNTFLRGKVVSLRVCMEVEKNTVGEKRRRKEAHKLRKKWAKQAARGAAGDEVASGEAAND